MCMCIGSSRVAVEEKQVCFVSLRCMLYGLLLLLDSWLLRLDLAWRSLELIPRITLLSLLDSWLLRLDLGWRTLELIPRITLLSLLDP